MGLIAIVLLVILIISAVLLVLVVLVQDEQGEGIGGIFGGGSNTAFGSRSGNVLTRFTAVLAAVFLVCCFGMAWISRTPSAGNVIGRARQQALNTTEQQSWWVQTPTPPANGAAPAPGATGTTSAPAGTAPAAPGSAAPAAGGAAPSGTAPATGGTQPAPAGTGGR
jgi:preprotein translocase subunit SecG